MFALGHHALGVSRVGQLALGVTKLLAPMLSTNCGWSLQKLNLQSLCIPLPSHAGRLARLCQNGCRCPEEIICVRAILIVGASGSAWVRFIVLAAESGSWSLAFGLALGDLPASARLCLHSCICRSGPRSIEPKLNIFRQSQKKACAHLPCTE